jgi:Spy/CpxP family protein refolding chaperone
MKKIIFVLAVIFAISFVTQDAYSQKRMHKQKNEFRKELKEKLNLSEEQEKKIHELRNLHQEVMIKYNADLDLKELELKKLKQNDNVSRNDMINLTKELSVIKNEIALAKVNHQMDVYDILDANQKKIWMEQQSKFGFMKDKMKNKMRHHRG